MLCRVTYIHPLVSSSSSHQFAAVVAYRRFLASHGQPCDNRIREGLSTILREPAIRPSIRLDECVGLISTLKNCLAGLLPTPTSRHQYALNGWHWRSGDHFEAPQILWRGFGQPWGKSQTAVLSVQR